MAVAYFTSDTLTGIRTPLCWTSLRPSPGVAVSVATTNPQQQRLGAMLSLAKHPDVRASSKPASFRRCDAPSSSRA